MGGGWVGWWVGAVVGKGEVDGYAVAATGG